MNLNQILQNNPKLQQFVNENKNSTPEQVMKKYGLDPALVEMIIPGIRSLGLNNRKES